MTHSSCGYPNSQRIAFLGDIMLNCIIREHFFRERPDWDIGRLTQQCGLIESNNNFASIASTLQITKYMKFGKTYDNHPDDIKNTKIKAEALEALFGAIYLDKGFEKTREIAIKLNII